MKQMETYLKTRRSSDLSLHGLQPAFFEHSAWDVALATQSLAYIDTDLAFAISRIYTVQQNYADLTRGILQATYLRPVDENLPAFISASVEYYGDIVLIEPQLLGAYDEMLPQLDRALGEPSEAKLSAK